MTERMYQTVIFGMVFGVLLIIAIAACKPEQVIDARAEDTHYVLLAKGEPAGLSRFIDAEKNIICYVWSGAGAGRGGISCIPLP